MERRLFLCSILLFLRSERLDAQVEKTAVCFLTRQPSTETLAFVQTLIRDANKNELDVFIAVDNNSFNITSLNISPSLRFIQIPNEQCAQHGYQSSTSLGSGWSNTTAWDKALLYFTLLNRKYSFVWLIEEDVFIPSTRAFLAVHRLYSNRADLVIPRNGINLAGKTSSWLWSMAEGKLVLPWSCSMVNVLGLGHRMLVATAQYVLWRGILPFHEFFFNTLAMQLNLTMVAPSELSTIVYAAKYLYDDVKRKPNNLFHPLKDRRLQSSWKEKSIIDTPQSY